MASLVFRRPVDFTPVRSLMTIDRSWIRLVAGVVLLAGILFAACVFSPGWQLERAFNRLLDAVEGRRWDRAKAMMAADYRDHWGFNREEALEGAEEAMRHFFTVEIQASPRTTRRTGREAEISARIQMSGRGTAVAEAVLTRINGLSQDFRFAWKRESWKPWDWKLHAVSQPELDPSWTP